MDPWEHDEYSVICTNDMCGEIKNLCKICKIMMDDVKSDICGHPTCVAKKAERMFD